MCFHTSISSCVIVQQCERFFGERKGVRFNIFPFRATRNTITKPNDHRSRRNKHISHVKHHTHFHLGVRFKPRPILKLSPPRKNTATLQVSTLTETKPSHLLLTLFFIFLTHFRRPFFFFLSHLPSTSCSRNSLHAKPCTLLRRHLLPLATRLFPSGSFLSQSSTRLLAP